MEWISSSNGRLMISSILMSGVSHATGVLNSPSTMTDGGWGSGRMVGVGINLSLLEQWICAKTILPVVPSDNPFPFRSKLQKGKDIKKNIIQKTLILRTGFMNLMDSYPDRNSPRENLSWCRTVSWQSFAPWRGRHPLEMIVSLCRLTPNTA